MSKILDCLEELNELILHSSKEKTLILNSKIQIPKDIFYELVKDNPVEFQSNLTLNFQSFGKLSQLTIKPLI